MSINERSLSPKDLEPLCGFDASMLKEWRRLKMLEHIGERQSNSHWKYTLREALQLAVCNSLRLSGLPGYVAIKVAQDIHDDCLKAAGFYGTNVEPEFELLAIWNNETSYEQQGVTSRYYPWASYEAQDYREISRFIRNPAPIIVDIHRLAYFLPEPLQAKLIEIMEADENV